MQFPCPHCRNDVELGDKTVSGEMLCPTCGSALRVEATETLCWTPGDARATLGRFVLAEKVGSGGFGTVYRAHDPKLDRTVAIKVPRRAAGFNPLEQEDRDRFLREARSVAQLRHPSIVPVHEVGEHDGQPFLVSEFVAGVTLADRLTARPPTLRQAAELIAAVADALQFAHDRGIVHRDIKPSNIMISNDDMPHLMDFGLAKRDAGEITMTMDGQVLGTPAYMSPEQARGEAHEVDGRSDIYSLGVILYELLTGELPFRGNTRMLLHQVLHDEPRPPRRLNDQIPRDLETICLKALAKEPARRYQAARSLADDLRRWLHGEPITARPVTRIEQLWRWTRRRPAVAGLAAALVLVVLGSIAGLTTLWLQAEAQRERALQNADQAKNHALREEEQRRRAEANFHRAREAVDKMLSLVGHERLRYVPQMERLRRDLLQEALRFNERFLQENGSDLGVQEEAAWALYRMGNTHEMLGDRDKAEQSYRRATNAFQKLVDASSGQPEFLRNVSRAKSDLANLLDDLGRHAEAEKVYMEVQAISVGLVSRFPGEPVYRYGLALSHYNRAMLLVRTGRPAEAEQDYRRAIGLLEPLAAAGPSVAGERRDLAKCLDALGSLLDDASRPGEAEEDFQRARDLLQELLDKFPVMADIQWDLARTEYNLGLLRHRQMQFPKAETSLRRSIELKEKLVADYPSTPDYRRSCSTSQRGLAMLLQQTGRPDEAEKHFSRAIALQEQLVADFPKMAEYRAQLADSHNSHSMLLLPLGRVNAAEQAVGQAVTEFEKLVAEFPNRPDYESSLGGALHNLAMVLMTREKWADARLRLDEAVQHEQAALAKNPRHPLYREFLRNHFQVLSDVLLHLADPAAAETAARQAIRIEEGLIQDYPDLAEYRSQLGATIHNMVSQTVLPRGRLPEARQLLEQAIVHQRAAFDANPNQAKYRTFLRNHWWLLSETLKQQGDYRAMTQAALQLPPLYPQGWEEHYRAAGLLVAAAGLAEADASVSSEQRQQLGLQYADQALALLQNAVQNGFKDVDGLSKDKNFDSLRGREEFQKLMAEMAKK